MSRGRIEKALSGFYYVNTGSGIIQCRARGKFRKEGMSPLVGDWVEIQELGGGEGVVQTIEPRTSQFQRPAAANVDQLVVIASAAIPVTDPYLIDRISAIATLKGCAVLQAVKDGRIPQSRHRSYVRLYEELKPLKEWEQNK